MSQNEHLGTKSAKVAFSLAGTVALVLTVITPWRIFSAQEQAERIVLIVSNSVLIFLIAWAASYLIYTMIRKSSSERPLAFDESGKSSSTSGPDLDDFYAQALAEVKSNNLNEGVMGRAIADAQGNRELCESLYLKYRAQKLFDEVTEREKCKKSYDKVDRQKYDFNIGLLGLLGGFTFGITSIIALSMRHRLGPVKSGFAKIGIAFSWYMVISMVIVILMLASSFLGRPQ